MRLHFSSPVFVAHNNPTRRVFTIIVDQVHFIMSRKFLTNISMPLNTFIIRGIAIYVHHKLQASQVFFNSPHHVWTSIKLQGSDSLLVGCIYRSPSSNIDTSTTSLCDLLTNLHNYTHLLICGDFNYKAISWSNFSGTSNNCHIEPFLDTIDDLFLFQHISEPTRYREEETPSLLDLVFTNEQDMINNLVYLPPLSDHVCIEFDLNCYSEPKKYDNL